MTTNSLIIWIVVGAIAGIVVDAVMGGLRIGMVGAIVIGIVGAIISGWLFNYFGFHLFSGFITIIAEALIGSVVLLLVVGVFRI
jgi:uncharacterized membrane protein YeaQ/YmgE (transglycosylase-associated protein family)